MRWFATCLCILAAAPATAQSTYVGGSLVGDIARFGKVEPGDPFLRILPPDDSSIDGEALGFGITAGRALGEQWGVELEFVRSGEIENRATRRLGPILIPGQPVPVLPGGVPIPIPIPSFDIEFRTELQHTTIGALAWVRHDVGDRMELSYLGGITFIRSEFESDIAFGGDFVSPGFVSLRPASNVIEYQAGPAVGIDASFKFGDHVAIVTGLRMYALTAESRRGWLIRPGAGVRWRF